MRPILALLAAAVGVAGWALYWEPRRLVIRRREVEMPWPAEVDGLTIACVSDLHAGAPQVDDRRVKRVVARLAAFDADLIALLGDFVDPLHHFAHRVPPHVVAARLSHLEAPRGVLAVLGNHDWAGEGDWMPRALHAARIRVLQDEVVEAGPGLWVAGMADLRTHAPDLAEVLAHVPQDAALVVLSHDPDLFHALPEDRPALMLSGHTHGGQVNLPFLRGRVTPSRFGYRYGEYRRARSRLIVTGGVGTSGWPVRFLRPPEVVLVTVRARTGSS
jgi:predicted MPP superfamily phosphohydrolase